MRDAAEHLPTHHIIVEQANWSKIIQARKNGVAWDDLRTRNGLSAVGMAIFERSPVAVQALLEIGCPLETEKLSDGQPFSLLWSALEKKLPAVMDLLLQAGADPNEHHLLYGTPIAYAAQHQYVEETLVLCAHGCIPNTGDNPSPLKMWIANLTPYCDYNANWVAPDFAPILALLGCGARIDEHDSEIEYARKEWFAHRLEPSDTQRALEAISCMEHNLLTTSVSGIETQAKLPRKI